MISDVTMSINESCIRMSNTSELDDGSYVIGRDIQRRTVDGFFFFSSRRRHTRFDCDWSSDVCSSDLLVEAGLGVVPELEDQIEDGTGDLTLLAALRIDADHLEITGEPPGAHAPVEAEIGRASCRERV